MIHKDLEVYKLSMALVKTIYEITSGYPKSECWGLTNQMRRAAISIPSNISEGAGRHSNRELSQFLSIALGSVSELETQIEISLLLNYIEVDVKESIIKTLVIIRRMLLNLIKSIKAQPLPLTRNP